MNFLTSLRTLLLALVLSIGISYAYAAWAPPTTTPPGGNIDAPVNVGTASQTKTGFLWSNGLGSTLGGYFSGAVGIGITPPAGLLLGVGGNVGADKYCDRNGNNCIAATSLGGSGGGGGGGAPAPYPYLCRYQPGFAYSNIYVGSWSSIPSGCTLAGNDTWTYYGQSSDRGGEPGACYCWKAPGGGSGIGVGQTWKDMSSSRQDNNTAYQNITGAPIMVNYATKDIGGGNPNITAQISPDNATWTTVGAFNSAADIAISPTVSFIVPNNYYYRINQTTAFKTLYIWAELR